MPEPVQDKLTDHNYDGIQEYDNPTPAWWTYIFILTAIFAPIYLVFTLLADGQLGPHGQYERAKIANIKQKFSTLGELTPDTQTLLLYATSEDEKIKDWRAFGASIFQSNCASCHGGDAGGGSAPNMTDNYYLNITEIGDIVTVIQNGVAGKGMSAWKDSLHPNEVILVAAYVASLRGTDVPGGLAPKGEVPPPWPVLEDDAVATPETVPETGD